MVGTDDTKGDDGGDGQRPPSDPRVKAAFRSWLETLATDPDAAMAAAMVYEAQSDAGRDAWLDALADEAARTGIPAVALYGPLLGVEHDTGRRARIDAVLATSLPASPRTLYALRGVHPGGDCVAVIVVPLYLDFVELLVCRYREDGGMVSARRSPLLRKADVLGEGARAHEFDGVRPEEAPLALIVEEIAHAVLADRRAGKAPPDALAPYGFLFKLDLPAGPS